MKYFIILFFLIFITTAKVNLKKFFELKNNGIGSLIYSTYCPNVKYDPWRRSLTCSSCKGLKGNVLSFTKINNGVDVAYFGETKTNFFIVFR
jgi:hypothetical protein